MPYYCPVMEMNRDEMTPEEIRTCCDGDCYICPEAKLIETPSNLTIEDKIANIKTAVETALQKYSPENVDIMRNTETNMIDIIYHSRHNSFSITDNVCTTDDLKEEHLDAITECYEGIGYQW